MFWRSADTIFISESHIDDGWTKFPNINYNSESAMNWFWNLTKIWIFIQVLPSLSLHIMYLLHHNVWFSVKFKWILIAISKVNIEFTWNSFSECGNLAMCSFAMCSVILLFPWPHSVRKQKPRNGTDAYWSAVTVNYLFMIHNCHWATK